ncbi:MAG: hypothetical protein OXF39_09215 [Nitrospira sp.]|nr:hypothetical protein [Nitrospira sp.]
MSDTIIFDTHRFVKRMTDAGMASPIAEALADEYTQLLERNLSTKQDIARLEGTTRQDIARLEGTTRQDIARLEETTRQDIARLEEATRQEIARLEETTRQDIARLEETTRQDIARLEIRLADSKVEIIKWNVGTMFAFGAILLALLKFL